MASIAEVRAWCEAALEAANAAQMAQAEIKEKLSDNTAALHGIQTELTQDLPATALSALGEKAEQIRGYLANLKEWQAPLIALSNHASEKFGYAANLMNVVADGSFHEAATGSRRLYADATACMDYAAGQFIAAQHQLNEAMGQSALGANETLGVVLGLWDDALDQAENGYASAVRAEENIRTWLATL